MIHLVIYVIFFAQATCFLNPTVLGGTEAFFAHRSDDVFSGNGKTVVEKLNTPIFGNNNKLFNWHDVVLLYKTKHNNEYKHVYLVDFSPNVPINAPANIYKLLFGKRVEGKLRVFFFETMNRDYLTDNFHDIVLNTSNSITITNKLCAGNFDKAPPFQREELNKIIEPSIDWGLDFHLYRHNCQDFSKYYIDRFVKQNSLQ
jgi:hypothetical protein